MQGCYGLGWTGLDAAAHYLVDVPAPAPRFAVGLRAATYDERPEEIFEDGYARLHLSDGTGIAEADLAARTVTFFVRHDYDAEAMVHPLLAGSAASLNHWLGRDSFHAGAVVINDKAWIVMGERRDGKSTLLAYLASRGLPVLADDLIVEADGDALAGPGFVDLRPDAAVAMGVGRDIGVLGARERARFDIGARPERARVGGWIALRWSETIALEPIPVSQRLPRLYDGRTVQHDPADPATYLRHAAKPFYELTRPRDWSQLPAVYDALVSVLS